MMNIKTYRNWRTVITLLIGATAVLSVATRNVCTFLLAVGVGIVLLFILRRKVKDVVQDERTNTIAFKAAQITVAIMGIGMALTGVVLVALNWDNSTSGLRQAGDGLLYATCALLLVNRVAYIIYSQKYGGRNE
jgi:uncharacterized membrane protein